VHVKIQIEAPPKLRGWPSCHEIWRGCAAEVAPPVHGRFSPGLFTR
jgi:hypothetical protein